MRHETPSRSHRLRPFRRVGLERALDGSRTGASDLCPATSTEASRHVADLEEIMKPVNPSLERMTFAIILISLGQLCYKSGAKAKGVLLGVVGILFLISMVLHDTGVL